MRFAFCILAAATFALAVLSPGSVPAQTYEEQVVELTNQERWDNGQLPPLKLNPTLATAADGHAVNMSVRDFFSSCDLDSGTVPMDRAITAGYTPDLIAENIAASFSTPSAVMVGFMFGIVTRDRILSLDYREIGVGYEHDPGDLATVRRDDGTCVALPGLDGPFLRYWVQDFAIRNDVYPVVINREAYETNTRLVDLYVYGTDWAISMRFRNAGSLWSEWEPVTESRAWYLAAGDGMKTVEMELLGPGAEVRSATDTILLNGSVVGIPGVGPQGPVFLHAAHPNPFRSTTSLSFELAQSGSARLSVYDVSGRRVAQLLDETRPAGAHEISWDGRGDDSRQLPAGLYFVRLDAAGVTRTTKLLFTR